VDDPVGELAHDVENGSGDDLIEGVLDESLEPTPEEPIELGNDKERDKHGTKKDANGRRDDAKGNNDKCQSLRHHRTEPEQRV